MGRERAVDKAIAERGQIVATAVRDWHLEGAGYERITKLLYATFGVDVSHRAVKLYIDDHRDEWQTADVR